MQASFFKENRRNLVSRLDGELVIITANGLLQQNADCTYPFRQDSSFYYLTGLRDLADAVLVMDKENEFLILPKQSEAEHIFGGSANCDEIAMTSGVQDVLENKLGWNRFKKLQQSSTTINTLTASPQKVVVTDSFYSNAARRKLIEKLKRINSKIKITDVRSELVSMRLVKQPCEIMAIKQAIKITGDGIAAARKTLRPGIFEYELEAELDYTFKKNNTNQAFQSIVSFGSNAYVLHNLSRQTKIKDSEFILFDVGAEYLGYSADISRTYGFNQVSKRHQDVYDAVRNVHEYAISVLKPNMTWRQWVLDVDDYMGRELIKLGLIKINNRKNVHKYFFHGIGHSLGLDVHDVCDYKIIKENMVITVEPGIYIKQESIGVRIEDDILITRNGAINLSKEIPYV